MIELLIFLIEHHSLDAAWQIEQRAVYQRCLFLGFANRLGLRRTLYTSEITKTQPFLNSKYLINFQKNVFIYFGILKYFFMDYLILCDFIFFNQVGVVFTICGRTYWLIETDMRPPGLVSIATNLRLNIAWLLDDDWLIVFEDFCKFFSPCLRILIASSVLQIGIWINP